jgi:hypothetical protein
MIPKKPALGPDPRADTGVRKRSRADAIFRTRGVPDIAFAGDDKAAPMLPRNS